MADTDNNTPPQKRQSPSDNNNNDDDLPQPPPPNGKSSNNVTSKKRKNPNDGSNSAWENAYKGVNFQARISTGRPDSPHFLFASSHTMESQPNTFHDSATNDNNPINSNKSSASKDDTSIFQGGISPVPQVIHRHVNDLCVVTAGDVPTWLAGRYPTFSIHNIQYMVQEPPPSSAAAKRKRQSKMLHNKKNVAHAITPTTVIATLTLVQETTTNNANTNGEEENDIDIDKTTKTTTQTVVTVPMYAGVWGTIMELNHGVTPQLLVTDPLFDGYLAVILPSGRFPPPAVAPTTTTVTTTITAGS